MQLYTREEVAILTIDNWCGQCSSWLAVKYLDFEVPSIANMQ